MSQSRKVSHETGELWVKNGLMSFENNNIVINHSLIPKSDDIFSLGNSSHKWSSVYVGPQSLWLEDVATHQNVEITSSNGVIFINGVSGIIIGSTKFTSIGIEFPDHTVQTTAYTGQGSNTLIVSSPAPGTILDLTKNIFTFSGTGTWYLPDDGQGKIFYFCISTGAVSDNITLNVSKLRKMSNGVVTLIQNVNMKPFILNGHDITETLVSAIFVNGAWNFSHGTSI